MIGIPKVERDVATNVVHAGTEKVAVSAGTVVGGVALTAAFSAGLAQMEYENKKRDLKDLYKEEIGAQFGKSKQKVRTSDIEVLAKSNRTVSEQLTKERKQRTLNIGTIFVGTLVAIGAAVLAGPSIAAFVGVTGILPILAKGVVAALAYNLVKNPIQKLGNKIFNMDYKTSHERIEAIHLDHEEGKSISRERVFSVFVHANPELDTFIEQRYGKKFDALSIPDKLAITEAIGSHLDIKRITDDINHGRIKATELAFAVDGTMSGVLQKMDQAPVAHTVIHNVKHKLINVAEQITGHAQQHEAEEDRSEALIERAHRHKRMTHVERLMKQRAEAAQMQQQRG